MAAVVAFPGVDAALVTAAGRVAGLLMPPGTRRRLRSLRHGAGIAEPSFCGVAEIDQSLARVDSSAPALLAMRKMGRAQSADIAGYETVFRLSMRLTSQSHEESSAR